MAARRSWSLFERRRLPPESQLELGKRRVRLPPNLANLSPAGRAQDHESDVARDVKPCLYVVPPVAAHLCRPVSDVSAGRSADDVPSARVGMVSMLQT